MVHSAWYFNVWVYGVLFCSFLLSCAPKPIYHHGDAGQSTSVAKGQPKKKSKPLKATVAKSELASPVIKKSKTAHPHDPRQISTQNAYQLGIASYYGKKFHGRKTANGETFNMYKMTAAHRVLPLGTYLKVTNMSNGHWVEVKVNDRGPFIEGRILDLSFGAALELEMVKAGTAEVRLEITQPVD